MNDETVVAVAEVAEQDFGVHVGDATSTTALVLDDQSMNRMMNLAEIMATGKATIPKHLQSNVADCLAVTMQAMQWRMNPFAVAQKTHLVNGTLGYEAQLVVAVINSRAPIKGRLRFAWGGDWSKCSGKDCKDERLTVTVSATFIGDDEPTTLTIGMHQVGGVRNSPLWAADPRQQLAYLCAKRWARLNCPDVILGVYTPDELDEIRPLRDVGPKATPAQIAAAARPVIEHNAGNAAERAKLIARLEKVKLERGAEDLADLWGNVMTKDERKLVGPDELARIKLLEPPPAAEPETEPAQGAANG